MASSRESRGAEDAAKRMKASGAWAKSAAAKLVEDAPRLGKAGFGMRCRAGVPRQNYRTESMGWRERYRAERDS
jgi:hypothetical protein